MNLPLRIIALAIMLGGACASLSAQWSAGFTGYAQSLSLSGDYPDTQGIHPAIGYGAGMSVAYRLTADLELTLEPSFDLRHGDVRETIRATAVSNPYDTTLATIRVTSLAIPIGVRIWSHGQTWMFTSGILPRLWTTGTRIAGSGASTSLSEALAQVEIGVFLGVGYQFRTSRIRVMPELRYEQGVSNVLSGTPIEGLPPAPILRTNGFSLRVACQYHIGGDE